MNTKGAKLRFFLEFAIFAIYSVTTGESRINIDSGSELCSIDGLNKLKSKEIKTQ